MRKAQGALLALMMGMMAPAVGMASSWEVQCRYGSFEEDNLACEAGNGFGDESSFSISYREGEDRLLFGYISGSDEDFSKEGAVEARVDDGEVIELGVPSLAYSDYFSVTLTLEDSAELLEAMHDGQYLRLRAPAGTDYATFEMSLSGFNEAFRTLRLETDLD